MKSYRLLTMVAALALAGAAQAQAQGPEGAPPPGSEGPPRPERRASMANDLKLLLALDARQEQALGRFLMAAAPPPPPVAADGAGRPGSDRAPPPPPPGPGTFLDELAGPKKSAEAEARDQARIAAGRAFWETLDAGQRAKLDALVRLHALPLGRPPMRPMAPEGHPPVHEGPMRD